MKAFSVNIILDASNSAEYNCPMTTINCEKKMIFLKRTQWCSTRHLAVQDCMMWYANKGKYCMLRYSTVKLKTG